MLNKGSETYRLQTPKQNFTSRPGWERRAITLARSCKSHFREMRGMSHTLHNVWCVSHMLKIHSISTLLITLLTVAPIEDQILPVYIQLSFFIYVITFSFNFTFYLLNTLRKPQNMQSFPSVSLILLSILTYPSIMDFQTLTKN